MPRKKGFRMRRTQRCIKSKSDASACICLEKLQLSVVAGTADVRASPLSCDALIGCCAVAAIKHVIAPVCTWAQTDIDDICVEGNKLAQYIIKASQKRECKRKELCKLIKQHDVFGSKWNVEIGLPVYKDFELLEEESLMYEKLQEYLLRDGMCLLNLHSAVSVIIHHNNYFVVVDFGTRDMFGLASDIGTSVVVFNTCLNDLMVHIRNLRNSLDAQWYAVSSISVKTGQEDHACGTEFPDSDVDIKGVDEFDNIGTEVVAEFEDSTSVRLKNIVRGSFHQGNDQFKYRGVQCMAIALVSLAKHTVNSAFSWQTKDLDRVVVLGDELYTALRDANRIRHSSNLLGIPDLPKQSVIDGENFLFEYGDFVSGDIDVVDSEFIESGVCSSLSVGLEKMLVQYDTCLLTLCNSTCAIISHNGHYALIDSHARSALGMVDGNGRSVVVYFSSLKELFNHISLLAKGLSKKQKLFEIAGICVTITNVKLTQENTSKIKNEKHTKCVRLAESYKDSDETFEIELDEDSAKDLPANDARTKCNISVSNCPSKKLKRYDVFEVNSDVEFVSDVKKKNMIFSPICKHVCQTLCTHLKVDFEKLNVPVFTHVGSLGVPCKNDSIVADGNCFFRAISQAVSGTQKYHRKIRLAVVQHLEENSEKYRTILRREYSSVSEYINKSKMKYVNSWATEVEIQATADYLGIDVFTFYDGRWLKYSCNGALLSKHSIYLENCHENHYETVVCVNEPELHSCYGYCKISTSFIEGYNIRANIEKENNVQGLENKKHLITKEMHHSVLKTMHNDTCCAAIMVRDPDVEVVENIDQMTFTYSPLSMVVAQTLCNKFNLNFERENIQEPTVYGSLGVVCKTENVVKDGNSFFRAVAQVITGSEKSHRKIRLAVVKYMENHSEEHMKLVAKEFASMSEYISKSKMQYVGYCASDIEFQGTANALGVDLFICTKGKWVKYSCMSALLGSDGIYLKHCENNNFEPVICVQHVEKNVCFDLCKVGNLPETQFMKYHENVLHKEKVKYMNKRKYQENVLYKEKVKDTSKRKYQDNVLHKENVKDMSKRKYQENILHKENVKDMSKRKYQENVLHKEKVKNMSKRKYQENVLHKEKVKNMSKRNYQENVLHKKKVKEMSKSKYRLNQLHRQNVKAISTKKYHENPEHKKRVKVGMQFKRQQIKIKAEQFDFVMQRFLDLVKDGPDFVCCVCQRLLFRHQVLNCNKDYYYKKTIALNFDKCVTEEYLHKCEKTCVMPCQWLDTPRGKLWICYTCHYKINKGEIPPECARNNLKVHPIPPELSCLNSLEQHLIALHIPFMKMLALPKGGQNGVHGPITCVPANIVQTSNLLPLSSMEGSLLPVKLKRKLTYKGHYKYQFVDTIHIRQALKCLKQINVHYKEIEFNEVWLNEFCSEQDNDVLEKETDGHAERGEASVEVGEDELLHDRQQHCMFQDTCLMPVDIGQEALDQYFDDIMNLAPAEGNNPVKLLSDFVNEAKCFPVLFPQGCNTYHENRDNRLTLSRYFNNRILHADGRFAQNVEYIFFAQYMSEIEQVVSSVSIALRKGKSGSMVQKVDDNVLNNEESLKKLLEFDDGFRFLKPIRGTPAFWQTAQRDLLACVRQLGIPTWFCSFSSADMRWNNLLFSILKQEGRTETIEQLQWADRCELLRRNPVTAARMFDFRWHCFLREVLMSSSHPIGKIKDYFYRVEFQQRGSPHVHCLFWIENAPVIDKSTDEEVIQFIDKYVTCELPSQDDSLLDIVTSVQQHSKRHSKTCKKKNTVCRFNFPRPVSARTFICRGKSDVKSQCNCHADKTGNVTNECACVNQGQTDFKINREKAGEILSAIKKALSEENCNYNSVEHLFKQLSINQSIFELAYKSFSRNTQVVLKREVNEVWINQYSKPLLKCWNANLDIQYVVDAYACVVYIISYISKSEREIGLLLSNAQREARKEGNVSAKEALKNLGSVYLHNRDVCAQESVYRLTNMHLKECSRKVVFVPTGDNIIKMSLPLKVLRQKATSNNLTTEVMWMTSIVDRYKNRPNDLNDLCMATFASEYRILSKNEKSKSPLKLNNGCGFITKRTRTKPAVARYVRFSEEKNSEFFYQSIMQLFLPYRVDMQLKPLNCETFEQFYKNGHVTFSDGSKHSVKSVVDLNRKKFEMEEDELDNIPDKIDSDGVIEDGWCDLCPEQELERLLCAEEMKDKKQQVEEQDENIPDLASSNAKVAHLEKKNNVMCRSDGLALIRSLNNTQLSIFYQIRQWCLNKIIGKNPDPLHIFITGGAGTGKSHLIKAIQYEAIRLLSTVCRHPDNTCVLLTAPTGIAAYNLHGTTIHHTFSIGKDVRLPYTPLGEAKLNCLRAKYSDLQILIIDEISMVDHNLLAYIHGRLRQIKQTGDFSPFGNVSVIAVGDFFQLPPVKGKPLYVDDILGINLWSTLFSVVELKKIVRQKDNMFAELLNRIRIRTKLTPMLNSDIDLLKNCETGEDSTALHIFPTNRQVNEHNVQQLSKTCPEYVEIDAQDFIHNNKTGKLELKNGHHSKTYNTCLDETLLLGKGARVMLCKNVDVMDGLVNGVCGTVTHIVFPNNDNKFPQTVYVKFDDNQVGAQRRKCSAYTTAVELDSTGIKPEEERVNNKGGLRRQFPLKLAWACTVHKVQGITVDKAVVCLKRIFAPGQAYVALSRVRSLSGLIIQDFEEKAIYCKDSIKDAIQSMPRFSVKSISCHKVNIQAFSVFLMNVQNLGHHLADLVLHTEHLQPNCIAVTETWLPADISLETIHIDGYSFNSQPRSLSYSSSNPTLTELQAQQHGGVGMYTSNSLAYNVVQVPNFNLECLICNYATHNILIAVIYRPPSYPISLFKGNLGKLLDFLEPLSNTIAVIGDFNDNILRSSTICKFITDRGFVQHVKQTTTEKGTLIDHVYVKTTHYNVESIVLPTYFSDHEGIFCSFTCNSFNTDEEESDQL
ncbi:uncharacterized protein [Sinocyclocheilus grahami]|uniref:uncharacterized protein n=1 Tax=Sinocyclocheilus grahami TaxID=75366 RepID=UPI0007AD431F|nr:PREDICTED: uncharacterized protein LOC107576620 [Sinocyclocheilus grahami]